MVWTRYLWVREVLRREVRFDENPRFLDWRPMYRVSRPGLSRITGASLDDLDRFFEELAPTREELTREASSALAAGAMMQAPLLYVLVRALRPKRVVETGVSSGYSARFLLEALERNQEGRLNSVGLAALAIRSTAVASEVSEAGRGVGWLVPPRLKARWTVTIGPTEAILPQVLSAEPGPIDLFLHDSLHQYGTMAFEYRTAWAAMSPGGTLCSHDVHANRAWRDFLRETAVAHDEELDHDLGVARAPM